MGCLAPSTTNPSTSSHPGTNIRGTDIGILIFLIQFSMLVSSSSLQLAVINWFQIKVVYITRTKHRTYSSYMWSMFEPYSTATWIALLISLLVQIVYGTFIRRFEFRLGLIKSFHLMEKFSQYCRVQINQGNEKQPFVSVTGLAPLGPEGNFSWECWF